MTDKERFDWARDKIVGTVRERQGIGTLSEKTVHAVLKNYYAPDEDMHEIPIEGSGYLYRDRNRGNTDTQL